MICYKWVLVLLLFCSVAFGSAIAWAAQPTAQEPPAEYVLTFNGKAVAVALGKETEVNVEGASRARIKLSRKPTRMFDKAGVKFLYPVGFAFQTDVSDPDLITWKITGSDSLIILMQHDFIGADEALGSIVPEIVKSHGKTTVRVVPSSLVVKGRTLSGKKLLVADSPTQEIFAFSTARATFVLLVQDNLTLDNKPTAEAAQLRKLLSSTLTFR